MSEQPGDALKGYPDVIRIKAQHYQGIAESIDRAVGTLNAISDTDGMEGKTIAAIKSKSGDLASDIAKAKDRYATTAAALITYANALDAAQTKAAGVNPTINSLNDEITKYNTSLEFDDLDDDDSKKVNGKLDTATSDLKAALATWHSAYNHRDEAAKKAKGQIEEVVTGKRNHGLEDPKKHWWDKVLSVVKKICDIAAVLSIFLAWVPILGEILLALTVLGGVIDIVSGIVDIAENGFSLGAVLTIVGGVLAVVPGVGALSKTGKAAQEIRAAGNVRRMVNAGKNAYRFAAADASTLSKLKGAGIAGLKAARRQVPGAFRKAVGQDRGKIIKALKSHGLENLESTAWDVGGKVADKVGGPGLKAMTDLAHALREGGKARSEALEQIQKLGADMTTKQKIYIGAKEAHSMVKAGNDFYKEVNEISADDKQHVNLEHEQKQAEQQYGDEGKKQYEDFMKHEESLGKGIGDDVKKNVLKTVGWN